MNDLAKEINRLLLENDEIKEYLKLKKEVSEDQALMEKRNKLDDLRRTICKNKEADSSEYYELLDDYKSDHRVKKIERLTKEIREVLTDIGDILSLK